MYGKIFQEIFNSTISEFGGDTMYVLMSMVILSDAQGYLRMTANSLARTIQKDPDIVQKAIKNLEANDPESSTPDYAGRRIIHLSEVTGGLENRGWWVINKEKYSKIASLSDRANQNRYAQQRFRDKNKIVSNSKQPSAIVSNSKQPSASVSAIPYVDVDVYEDVDVKIKTKGKTSRFAPPSLQEVQDYCQERENSVNPQKFIDHYDANGWVRGKTKIKCWKSCVRTWESRDNEGGNSKPPLIMKSQSQILRVGAQRGLSPRPGETTEQYETRIRTTRDDM